MVFTSAPVINLPPSNPAQFYNQFEDDDISLVFGIGAEYRFNDRINIRAEWERPGKRVRDKKCRFIEYRGKLQL
jgi:hypothetical protein